MERRELYQNDLTEENMPSPGQREGTAHTQVLDSDVDSQEDDDEMEVGDEAEAEESDEEATP